MKTPAFWSEPNFLSRLLKPLGTVYAFATRLRIGLGRPCKIGTDIETVRDALCPFGAASV